MPAPPVSGAGSIVPAAGPPGSEESEIAAARETPMTPMIASVPAPTPTKPPTAAPVAPPAPAAPPATAAPPEPLAPAELPAPAAGSAAMVTAGSIAKDVTAM